MSTIIQGDTIDTILDRAKQLELDKTEAIAALQRERVSINNRLGDIKVELRQLGYKVSRPRKAKAA